MNETARCEMFSGKRLLCMVDRGTDHGTLTMGTGNNIFPWAYCKGRNKVVAQPHIVPSEQPVGSTKGIMRPRSIGTPGAVCSCVTRLLVFSPTAS